MLTVLMFFAHPDDEVLAAGATMKKLSDNGATIHVAIPATGIHSRRNIEKDAEQREAALFNLREDCVKALAVVGVQSQNIYLGEFRDNEMDSHSLLDLIHWLEAIIDKVQPDTIFTHHFNCTNIDHRYCHEAVIVATRPAENSHITVLTGEVPSSTGYLKPTQWDPNYYVDVTNKQVRAKIEAMQSYKGEARPDPHPRSPQVLGALAKVRGSESGFMYAEAFMVGKMFG